MNPYTSVEINTETKEWINSFLSKGIIYKYSKTVSGTLLYYRLYRKPKKSSAIELDIIEVLTDLLSALNKYTNVSVVEFRNLQLVDDFEINNEDDKGARMISIKIDLKQINMNL